MNQDRVQELTNSVTLVQVATTSVLNLLAASGMGGHLNDEQSVVVIQEIESLAAVALKAYAASRDEPITPESILALLPDTEPLPPPTADDVTTGQDDEVKLASGGVVNAPATVVGETPPEQVLPSDAATKS